MKMSNMFALMTSQEQLPASNRGMTDMHYVQYSASKDVTGANFPNGTQYIKFTMSGTKWWIPKRSYLRMRATITKADGTPITTQDDIAPNMALMANLYQSLEFRINGKVVSRISDYVPQIDMLDKRLNMSKSWLDGGGASTGFYNADARKRAHDLSTFGAERPDTNFINEYALALPNAALGEPLNFLDLTTPNQVEITIINQLIFTPNAGRAIPDLSLTFNIGDIIAINDGGQKVRRITAFQSTNTTNDTIVVDGAALTAVAAANLAAQVRIFRSQAKHSRRISGFETSWQPPLGIFKVKHAMPAGDYELVLNPQPSTSYQRQAIESITRDKIPGTGNDFIFTVVDLYLYVCEVDGPRSDNINYYLDLDEITCQKKGVINSTSLQQEQFNVSPSTYALTLAFQDSRTLDSSQLSASKFRIGGARKDELKLRRMYINYSGMNKPQPDADPSYKQTAVREDYTVQRYLDSTIYSGTYFESGSNETIEDWHERGPYYYFFWPRDGTDRSTRVNTNYQFSEAISNAEVMLFNHFKKAALIKIENGKIVHVQVEEM